MRGLVLFALGSAVGSLPPLAFAADVSSGTIATGVTDQIRVTVPMQEQGADLYGRMCAVCHGPSGEGYKADRAPALANPDFLASVTDDSLRNAIADGRMGTTMSAWSLDRGGPLSLAEIDSIISFLRTWEHGPRAKLDEGPVTGSAPRGEKIFSEQCERCHGNRGIGGWTINVGSVQLLRDASNGFLRYAIRSGRKDTAMAGYEKTLGDAKIEDVIAWLRVWQSSMSAHIPAPPVRHPPIPLGPVPLNPKGPEPEGFKAYPATTPADVIKAQLDHHAKMGILDARAPSDYINEHIAGAVSVPFYDPSPYLSALPKDSWLVCYCACPHAESGKLAQKLEAAGFTKVTVLDEGLGYWRSKKYETRSGIMP